MCMKKSPITKKYITLAWIFGMLSFMVLVFPVAYYMILGFIYGGVTEKLILSITFVIALILLVINLVFKFHIRSTIWIIVLGIYFCIASILPLLLMVAIGNIIDEFLLSPLHKMYHNKAIINREIDRRNG